MDKEQIKQIIGENQEFVKDITFMERPFTFEDAGNYVFLGIRRAGKSYLMYQRIHQLLKKGHAIEEILYINFEDERLEIGRVGRYKIGIRRDFSLSAYFLFG